ncbi:unnamed protein product [Cylicostephanus goldi]|uniref:Uncharacterized protein n=1 Tax=Cylicostephanus goldi TaxID=71465 RepID=A0A3P6RMT9_CYLGO|nr:unnamed protein product [Cylicostephanus goldi]
MFGLNDKKKENRKNVRRFKDSSRLFQLSRVPKIMQQAIEQHFPSVSEAASIKVDKDTARRPADSDFARATLRARRQQGSNDVRQLMYSEDAYQRRAPSHVQRQESDGDYRSQAPIKIAQKIETRNDHKEAANAEAWNKSRSYTELKDWKNNFLHTFAFGLRPGSPVPVKYQDSTPGLNVRTGTSSCCREMRTHRIIVPVLQLTRKGTSAYHSHLDKNGFFPVVKPSLIF